MTTAQVLWLLIFAAALLLQGYAIGNPGLMDTGSENVWLIRSIWIGRVAIGAFMGWAYWHWVIDRNPAYGWSDVIAAVVGVVSALLAGPRRSGADDQPEDRS